MMTTAITHGKTTFFIFLIKTTEPLSSTACVVLSEILYLDSKHPLFLLFDLF